MKIIKENENDICRFELNNSKQISLLLLKEVMKTYLQVKHRNKLIKYTNKRTVSRKKFHFLAVGDIIQLLPGSIFLFKNCMLGNHNHRTAAKVAWSLRISTPNSCPETAEAQKKALQISSYFSCSIWSAWYRTPHLQIWQENRRRRF